MLGVAANTARERMLRAFPDVTFLRASPGHQPHNKTTLDEYRKRVADLEAEAVRCKQLYEQTRRLEDRDRWEDARLRVSGARTYLRKREKQEAV